MIDQEEENLEKTKKNESKYAEFNKFNDKHKIQQFIGNRYMEEVKEEV